MRKLKEGLRKFGKDYEAINQFLGGSIRRRWISDRVAGINASLKKIVKKYPDHPDADLLEILK